MSFELSKRWSGTPRVTGARAGLRSLLTDRSADGQKRIADTVRQDLEKAKAFDVSGLDHATRTSIEVMGIFQRLNRERGITVMLITHEPDIAQYAERIVHFRDGKIVRDEAVRDRRDAEAELREEALAS